MINGKIEEKNCKTCHKLIPPKPHARNVKFCCVHCRNVDVYSRRGGAETQRKYLDQRNAKNGKPKIKCAICGRSFRQVGTHIVQIHKITAREYREQNGFDVRKGQLPEDYRQLKAERAIECGGAVNLLKGKKYWFNKGQKGLGLYHRSEQTLERLSELGKRMRKINTRMHPIIKK